jgi:DNA-binding NtrC family response regulator
VNEKILLIDDDSSLLRVTEYQLSDAGYKVLTASNGRDGWELFQSENPELILTDLNMPEMEGLELIKKIRGQDQSVPVIVITAFGSIDNALKTTQAGADDYLTKPFSIESLKFSINKNLKIRKLHSENTELKNQLFDRYLPENIIGQSSAIKKMQQLISKLSEVDSTVLILGESGTGKELVARAIHYKSRHSHKPFVAINCASIPENLIESELFGHVRGSFTGAIRDQMGKFESVDDGTLFLDEIGDLNLDLQAKLLRVLQDREFQRIGENKMRKVRARILAATHQDLEKMVKNGTFRQDLFYRLNIVPVSVPPLRERREDIPLLVRHFIQKLEPNRRFSIGDKSMDNLVGYHWPGNVRELENLIERLSILKAGDTIQPDDLMIENVRPITANKNLMLPFPDSGISLEELEKTIILEALKKNRYNQSNTAKFLKIPRHVLIYRMKKYNL